MNISFVYPNFLFALSLIAIPVIIHLFNFRRFRKVFFTNVKFLKELKEETTNRSRLKHLLVLLSRILAVSFLVFAFAQPFIPAEKGMKISADRALSIYIDNSFSMEAITREGTLLDVAKKKAREVALAYKPSDRFQLLTNDFEPVHQRLISRDDFISAVDLVKISPSSRKISEVLTRQTDALNVSMAEEKSSVIISDFQKSMAEFNPEKKDTSFPVTLIPVETGSISNLFIDSCWFSSPVVQLNQPAELNVRIKNSGETDVTAVPVKLNINGNQKAVAGADINSNNYTDVKLTFSISESGWQKAEINIIDNPVTFDDKYYFSFFIAEKNDILSINGPEPGPYLDALFGKDSYFKLASSDERQIDYSSFKIYSIIFLNGLKTISSGLTAELNKYIDNGGTLVILPDSAIDFESYKSLYGTLGMPPITSLVVNQEKVDKLMVEDELFNGVFSNESRLKDGTDFPFVNKYFLQPVQGSGEVLMQLRSGAPFMTRYRKGKGEVYSILVPLNGEFSNFSRHALFVPVMYRLALLSEKGERMAFFIGKDERIELPSTSITGDAIFHLTNENLKFDVIPGHRVTGAGVFITVNNQVVDAGNYNLKLENNLVSAPSFNYNRDESEMNFFKEDDLNATVEKMRLNNFSVLNSGNVELTRNFSVLNEGTRLWKYCILLVLLFLAIEIMLLKFLKK